MKRFFSVCLAALMAVSCLIGAVPAKASGSAYVYSFSQFKDAMESESITDIYLYNVDDSIYPRYAPDQEAGPAIVMTGSKKLHLKGKAIFRIQDISVSGYMKYSSLLWVPEGASLTVDGNGYLGFTGFYENMVNAAIVNEGNLVIHSGSIAGINSGAAYSRAIYHTNGTLTINGGYFTGTNAKVYEDPTKSWWSAVWMDSPATIRGGSFNCHNYDFGNAQTFGLMITSSAPVTITGGIYKNLYLPSPTVPLSNFVPDTHTVLVDGRWINKDSEYSHDYVFNAVVKVVNWIREVNVSVTPPEEGAELSYGAAPLSEGFYLGPVKWYQNGTALDMYTNPVAMAGCSYQVEVPLYIEYTNSYEFASSGNLTASINGNEALISQNGSRGMEKSILLTLDFGVCKSAVNQVFVSIDTPKDGHTIPYTAAVTNSELCSIVNGSVVWYEDGEEVSRGETFDANREYSVSLQVQANRNCAFPVDEWGEPNAYARINGYDAQVLPVDGQDPSQVIELRFEFGIVNDTVIEEIRISGVSEPVVDEKPSYNATVSGIGYHLDANFDDAYGDAINNGIGWWDITADNWVYPDETFQIGHQYKAVVYVATDADYEFYTTGRYFEPEGWGYINNNYATFSKQTGAQYQQTLSWIFTCQPKTVKSIAVTGLDAPVDGAAPDFDAITDSEYYTVESIEWYDCENDMNVMTNADTFVGGNEYYLIISVVPNEVNGNKLCKFVQNKTSASLNGNEVRKSGSWNDVTSTTKKVTIWYSFAKAAFDQESGIRGSITSFGSDEDELILQLIPLGYPEPAYEAYAINSAAGFSITGVAPGSYILRAMMPNHVPRDYTVQIGDQTALQDVVLHLVGDVTGDGRINVGDVARAYGHAKKSALLEDEYMMLCADVTGDGRINVGDAARIYGHAKKTAPLW